MHRYADECTIRAPLNMASVGPLPFVRYAYYAFIFSIPIETLDIGIERGLFSLSKLAGIMFIATALLQPQVCFRKPPKPIWCFLSYILVCVFLASLHATKAMGTIYIRLFTLVMMVVLFWVSYSLLQHKTIVKGALLTLIVSCVLLATVMIGGGGMAVDQGRVTALSQNANALAATLSLGLLALLGLAHGRDDTDRRIGLLVWLSFGFLAVAIVSTGSRGPMLGLLAGILLLTMKRGNSALRFKLCLFVAMAIAVLVWASYENDAVRLRWEKAFMKGNLSRREEIIPEAWNMFMERPLLGWGPVSHYVELGARFDRPSLDTHNLYLWIMTEAGLLGAIPFFIGLWLCWRAAWNATYGPEGSLPMAMLTCLLILNLSGSEHNRKLFWVVLAYSLASESFRSQRWPMPHSIPSIEKTQSSSRICHTPAGSFCTPSLIDQL